MVFQKRLAWRNYVAASAILVGLSFIISWVVILLYPRVTIDFSPGKIEKWLAFGAALCLFVLAMATLRNGKTALCLLLPVFFSLNFVLITVGIKEEIYLANNQIGYRPWILIYDLVLIVAFVLSFSNWKVKQVPAYVKAFFITGGLFFSYIMVSTISLVSAKDMLYVWLGVFALARFMLWFGTFLLIFINDVEHLKHVTWGMAGFVTFQFAVSILQAFHVPTVERIFQWSDSIFIGQGGIVRVGGTMGRAHLESMLLLIIPLLFAYAGSKALSGTRRKLMILCGILGFIMVFLTGSRGPMVATIVGTAVALRLFRFFRPRRIQVRIWALLAITSVAGLIIVLQSGDLSYTLLRRTDTFRVETFEIAWRMFEESPLTGVGLNNYLGAGPDYGMSDKVIQFGRPVHNQFLLAAAETGIIGLTILALNFLYWGWLSIRAASTCHSGDICWFPKGVQGSLVAFFLTSLLDAPLIKPPVISVLALLVAGVCSLAFRRQRLAYPHEMSGDIEIAGQ